ncbi:hypothetical protein AGABI2DRAFT_181926 [Agaricus bisporus var. bisporus H97]|uniref:hypothetical protein n=1 Tax=Agaricus bisporus var. bisporus (strain H97 / ATCC MYA-4626 / FGSC 10389) TaxID=936046 RepID=UPI00029F6FC9|nr:hypothetical protein AGABI2DRAFT_181926 [Agaricus bisporus var. bisporus H97]EKV50931.1 hypothetical protein AGABI2DRAFT_181926 [Agaricus bisporus var. bisporus H97]
MPPRRSSRTRASVEPTQVESLPAKRKRGSTAELVEGKENTIKASSRRSSSKPSVPRPRERVASRSKTSLVKVEEDIGDGEEEEVVEAPVKKKPRPSLDPELEAENDEQPSQSSRTRRSLRGSVKMEVDEDEGALNQPTKRTASKRTKASSKKPMADEEVNDEEGEDVKPPKRGTRVAKKVVIEDPEEEENADVPSRGSRKPPSRRSKARVSIEEPEPSKDDDSESDDDIEVIPLRKSQKPPPSTQPELPQAPEEEEEERSLFDPAPVPVTAPAPETSSQTIPEQPSGPRSRLVIHKIVLVNFKSYAGRQEIGPFHKSFSAIVGPNGSGKSNTIDALLFVFGYRASKMRQAKVSELIHNSAAFPNLDECSVEVHFREIIDLSGPDAYQTVPNSDLVVARYAQKNNQSRYTVNRETSNYTDVRTLLKGRGIDLDHKRFLILQGEVESIAQMKPKAPTEHEDGLLEYLEDIIGTSSYKEDIDTAFKSMEEYQEERQMKLTRLKFVEKEKAALESQKKEAEDYLRMKNEHVRAQSRYWQWILWKCFQAEATFEAQLAKHQKDLAAETEKNQDDITHLKMLNKHYKEREAAYQEVKEAAEGASRELTGKEKQEVQLLEKQKHANGKAKKLKKLIQEEKAAKKQAERDFEDSTEKIKKNRVNVEEQEANLEEEEQILESIRDGLKDKTQTFHDQIEVKQKELQPWTTKINAKTAAIDIARSERDALAQKAEAIQKAGKEAEENLQTKRTEHQGKECRNKASSTRHKVEEARASQSENRSQGKVLDSLQRLKSRGQIHGFHGRLGSLGTIDERYDVAVSTACGQLNHLVVDTVEQAQQCIEYLRSQNIGRATFMVLEKIPAENGMKKIQTPENAPRLFDLIKSKEARFAPAFYKALRDTLVAEDLDQANRVAYGATRWRVVTLAGQMFETSGTMSGGGGQPSRGGMSSKFAAEGVRPEVMQQYERDSEDAARKLNQAMEETTQAESEFERLKRLGPELDMALQKLGLEIETGKRSISEAEKRVRDLKAQNKPNQGDLKRISVLDAEIESTAVELDQLNEKSGKIEQGIKALERRILEIGGSRLLGQKSKVDGIRLHINIANEEITRAEVARAKAEKDIGKLTASVESNEAVYEECQGEVKELEDTLQELRTYLQSLRGKYEDAQQAAEDSKEDLDQLKKELDEKDDQIKEFLKKQKELEQKILDTQKELKENGAKIEHWQSEHDKLELEEIDDDDDDDDEESEKISKGGEDEREGSTEGGEKIKPDPEAPPKEPAQKLHEYTPDELSRYKKQELLGDVELLDEKIKNAKPDLSVLKEYKRREAEFENRAKELEEITKKRDEQKEVYDRLRKKRLDEFMAGFNLISMKLKEMYQMITRGGNAELELVDSLDPFSEGIIFSVMPPKKSWKNISNLSGGEKTLSSLALVFALHHFKPTPLYFMDEIDAALDFMNVSIVANYIRHRTRNAQFIIISLRNDMFELSHRLIGIYKTSNATRSVSIDNHILVQKTKQSRAPNQSFAGPPPPTLSTASQIQSS